MYLRREWWAAGVRSLQRAYNFQSRWMLDQPGMESLEYSIQELTITSSWCGCMWGGVLGGVGRCQAMSSEMVS